MENQKHLEQVKKFHVAKDLLFIQSELSEYLIEESPINHDFLDMIVSVMSIRNLHSEHMHHDELLLFGAKAIVNLIPKVARGYLTAELLDKVFQLFMLMNMKKARAELAAGLLQVLGSSSKHRDLVKEQTLGFIANLNKLKRGVADMELDADNVIVAIKAYLDQDQSHVSVFDVVIVAYNILYLISNEEYSVREYAEHAFVNILKQLKQFGAED
jgi:hypothetical protein